MFTSRDLKATITEARPIVERQLDDAELIAGLRETVTTKGGDWSQVKALVKAMIQDERDEAGGHKRVNAMLSKAGNALGYADMLGLGNLNEKNSFAEDEPEHDADGVIIEREVPATVAAVGASPATLSAAAAQAANANVENDDVATPPAHAPEQPGKDHGSVSTPDEGGADSSEIHPSEAALLPQTGAVEAPVDQSVAPAPQALAGTAVAAGGDSVDPSAVPAVPLVSNVTPLHRFNPATHFANSNGLPRLHGCARPEACGGSHRALCFTCSTQHDGPAYQDGVA